MAYFPNGEAGLMYEDEWCNKCVHQDGCAVWLAHMIHNYAECNKPDSILNLLIPEDEKGYADKCAMFYEAKQ